MDIAGGQVWRHYRGGIYKVLCLAKIEADETPVVVYMSPETKQAWVRPVTEWLETVDGVSRFTPITASP
jgi:hypothetical protein